MGHCPCFGRKKEINNSKINEEETNLTNSPDTPSTAIQTSNLSPVESAIEAKPSASTVEPSQPSVSAPDADDPQDKVEKAKVFTYRELADATEKESYIEQVDNKAQVFTYRELAKVTKNFRKESLIGEGGFGPVYKGQIEKTGQVVAVKKLNQSGLQGNKEFMVEILMLSLMRHPNIVTLIGYCAEGDQRLLVYEFMPLGSLESHLHDVTPDKEPLDWNTRMKIAAGAAQGLDYLHTHNDPPVIYRDMKAANILLGEGYHPKLSDLGMAKFGPTGEMTHVSTRVMGTHGYCAPEYGISGKLTLKSDIYSFGVVLLELITGRRALEMTRHGYRMLIDWARPMFKDRKKFVLLADPRLKGQFLERILQKTVEVVLLCIQDDSQSRPNMSEVVVALNYLASHKYNADAGGNDSSHGRGGQQWNRGPQNNVDANAAAEPMSCPDLILSPREKDPEREKAVAEAKMWGESCRQQRRLSAPSEIDHKDRI